MSRVLDSRKHGTASKSLAAYKNALTTRFDDYLPDRVIADTDDLLTTFFTASAAALIGQIRTSSTTRLRSQTSIRPWHASSASFWHSRGAYLLCRPPSSSPLRSSSPARSRLILNRWTSQRRNEIVPVNSGHYAADFCSPFLENPVLTVIRSPFDSAWEMPSYRSQDPRRAQNSGFTWCRDAQPPDLHHIN